LQTDDEATVTVVRKGAYKISPSHNLYNNHLYNGKDNDIEISRDYRSDFICGFDMGYYPFDLQHCSMKFTLQASLGIAMIPA
jgi:hypothetical protein